jgi:8-oxo-dGTP diphosphatase
MGDFAVPDRQNGVMNQGGNLNLQNASPVVGVGAVIWNAAGEIVLIRRGQEPRLGEWSIPGGRLEWGETVETALLREVREETGLHVEIAGLIDVVDSVIRDAGGAVIRHYVLIDFSARYVSGELVAGTDAAEARWVAPTDLDQYSLWTETRRIIETARTMRG